MRTDYGSISSQQSIDSSFEQIEDNKNRNSRQLPSTEPKNSTFKPIFYLFPLFLLLFTYQGLRTNNFSIFSPQNFSETISIVSSSTNIVPNNQVTDVTTTTTSIPVSSTDTTTTIPQVNIQDVSSTATTIASTSSTSTTVSTPTATASTTSTGPTTTTTSSSDISFKLYRAGYTPLTLDDAMLKYEILQSFDTLVEPHVGMRLIVTGYTDTTVYYQYQVCSKIDPSVCQVGILSCNPMIATNVDVTIDCDPFEEFDISISEVKAATGTVQRTQTGSALCLYVRREIRSLSDADLSATMDALYTLYSVPESQGQELYGEHYHDSQYALNFHHFNAAWQDSDHIHEGNGFLPQHIKMTNIVERAMQAVDPSVTVPYWDFTIDQAEGHSSVSSFVMTPDVFGNMVQPAELNWGYTYESDQSTAAAIPDGRWAYLKADMNSKYPDLKTGYGYMRAPWNMNPSPYVSRFTMDLEIGTSLPTCEQHNEVMEYAEMMDFFYQISYAPHATVHSLTGGIFGCDKMIPLLEAGYITDETNLKTICASWVFYLKEFYRYNYIQPWTNCTVDSDNVDSSACGFTCTNIDDAEFTLNMKSKLSNNVPSDMSNEGWIAWKDFICTGDGQRIFSGDHLESASPADPSFWVIHPTLERLLHAKLMSNGFKKEDWRTDAVNEDVCDKAECYESSYAARGYYSECCYGHFEHDQVYDFVSGNRSHLIGDTNAEIVAATDPRSLSYQMPYIYDSFAWPHCSQDFSGLLESYFYSDSSSTAATQLTNSGLSGGSQTTSLTGSSTTLTTSSTASSQSQPVNSQQTATTTSILSQSSPLSIQT